MAELLVRNKPHWMDSLTQAEVDALPSGAYDSYLSRCQPGDIVVVRPDGWQWGGEECLPNFVVVKLAGVSEADAKIYESPITEELPPDASGRPPRQKMIRFREYTMPAAVGITPPGRPGDAGNEDLFVEESPSVLSLDPADLSTVLIQKTGDPSEVTPPA